MIEDILNLRMHLVQEKQRALSEKVKKNYPPINLGPLISYLEKTDKELERVQDKIGSALRVRARAGDGAAEMLADALEQTRELLLDLLKMADDFED